MSKDSFTRGGPTETPISPPFGLLFFHLHAFDVAEALALPHERGLHGKRVRTMTVLAGVWVGGSRGHGPRAKGSWGGYGVWKSLAGHGPRATGHSNVTVALLRRDSR